MAEEAQQKSWAALMRSREGQEREMNDRVRWIDAKREMLALRQKLLELHCDLFGENQTPKRKCTPEEMDFLYKAYDRVYVTSRDTGGPVFVDASQSTCKLMSRYECQFVVRDGGLFETYVRCNEPAVACSFMAEYIDDVFCKCDCWCSSLDKKWDLKMELWKREHRRQHWDQLSHDLLAERWHPRNAHRFADWGWA